MIWTLSSRSEMDSPLTLLPEEACWKNQIPPSLAVVCLPVASLGWAVLHCITGALSAPVLGIKSSAPSCSRGPALFIVWLWIQHVSCLAWLFTSISFARGGTHHNHVFLCAKWRRLFHDVDQATCKTNIFLRIPSLPATTLPCIFLAIVWLGSMD